jgi:hypothetical protein
LDWWRIHISNMLPKSQPMRAAMKRSISAVLIALAVLNATVPAFANRRHVATGGHGLHFHGGGPYTGLKHVGNV